MVVIMLADPQADLHERLLPLLQLLLLQLLDGDRVDCQNLL